MSRLFAAFMVLVSVISLSAPIVAADVPASQIKLFQENINYFDVATCDTSASPTTGTEVADDQLPGKDNQQKIWNYLIGLGLKPVEAAGIEGNIGREGVYDPTNIEDPAGQTKDWNVLLSLTGQGQGYGLIGFTPGRSLAKGDTSGADWSSISKVNVNKDNFYFISTQLDVVYGYMKNSKAPDGKNMLEEYKNRSTNPGEAALAFEDLVENPGVLASDERVQFAYDAMKNFADKPATPVPTSVGAGTLQCGCPSGGSADVNLEGNTHVEQAFNFFLSHSLTDFQAAVIVGTIMEESGHDLSTTITNGSTGAYGIAQWTNPPYSSRLPALKSYAHSQGKPASDFATQLGFMWKELSGSYKSSLDTLKHQTDINKAVYDFEATYEVSGHQLIPERQADARSVLHKFGGTTGPGGASVVSGSSGATGCPTASASGYLDPLRDLKNLGASRIDMGVDYTGEGPVYAIGNGQLKSVATTGSGWPDASHGNNGAFIVYTLTDGPAKGKDVYVAENCTPKVTMSQKTVNSSTVLCVMHNVWPYIETGWAAPSGGTGYDHAAYGAVQDGTATAHGVNFSDFMRFIGGTPGNGHLSTNWPNTVGNLDPNWPRWKQ